MLEQPARLNTNREATSTLVRKATLFTLWQCTNFALKILMILYIIHSSLAL